MLSSWDAPRAPLVRDATLTGVRTRHLLCVATVVVLTGCSSAGQSEDADSSTAAKDTAATSAASTSSPTPLPATPRVVVIDPGHNGGNSGATEEINRPVPDGNGGTKACNTVGTQTNAGYAEHAFAWTVALAVRDLLTAQGIQVVLTRADDIGVGPCVDARAAVADQAGAAAFVSIHADGSDPGNRGFHLITSNLDPAGPDVAAASQALAVAVRDAMSAVLPPSNYIGTDGLNARDDLAGLNLNLRPAVYLECGNMRDRTDAALLSGPDSQAEIAAAITSAVLAFLG